MKAMIRLDVPDWQIGKQVSVYFPDTMYVHGICEAAEVDDGNSDGKAERLTEELGKGKAAKR